MSVPFLIIDGYNLLHAAGLARLRYGPGDLERARQRMLGMLCEKLSPAEQMRCTVVFDAQNAPSDVLRESRHRELRVLFAPSGIDADSVIEDLVARHPSARQLIVVSSDHRLHKAARRRGATAVDSDPFWDRLQQRPDARTALVDVDAERPSKPARPSRGSSRETEQWLAEFGEVSVDDLAAEVRAEEQTQPGGSPWDRHLGDLERTMGDPQELERFLRNDAERKGRGGRQRS